MLSLLFRFALLFSIASFLCDGFLLGPGRMLIRAMSSRLSVTIVQQPLDKQAKPTRIESAMSNKRPWTSDEDERLRAGIKEYGTQWALISRTLLPQREGHCCRQRWMESLNPEIKLGPWTAEVSC